MRSFTKWRIRIWQMSSYKIILAPARYIIENVFLPVGIKEVEK